MYQRKIAGEISFYMFVKLQPLKNDFKKITFTMVYPGPRDLASKLFETGVEHFVNLATRFCILFVYPIACTENYSQEQRIPDTRH